MANLISGKDSLSRFQVLRSWLCPHVNFTSCALMVRESKLSLVSFFKKTLILLDEGPTLMMSSNLITPLEAPSLNIAVLGVRASRCEHCRGHKHSVHNKVWYFRSGNHTSEVLTGDGSTHYPRGSQFSVEHLGQALMKSTLHVCADLEDVSYSWCWGFACGVEEWT